MKGMKKALAVLLSTTMLLSASGVSAFAEEGDAQEPFKVGMCVYNLSNPQWAALAEEGVRYGKEQGLDVSYVDAGEDSAKQISQIENYIQSGVDCLIILSIDTAAVEPVAKKAREQGIYVIDYCRGLENADTSYLLDAEGNGYALVEMAKEWIDEHYAEDETFDWGFLDIPTVELGVLEGEATEKAMKELCPNGNLVANAGTLTVDEGLTNAENILQANPDLRVMLGISAGASIGGNEAMKAASGGNYDEYGLFSVDATEQELVAIMNGECLKGTISNGSGKFHAHEVIDYAVTLLNGGTVEKINYMPIEPVTADNVEEMYEELYGDAE